MRKILILFFSFAAATFAQSPKLVQTGQTFNRAQSSAWINSERVVVGRWDGTLTVFRPPHGKEYGPILTQVITSPSMSPVVTVIPISSTSFVISNGDDSIALCSGDGKSFSCPTAVSYDSKLGAVESGTTVSTNSGPLVVTGHAQGYIATWSVAGGALKPIHQILTRSLNPIPSPYQLWDVRGIVPWKDGLVVAGSEDGDLILFDTSSSQVLTRIRYNQNAQRGINSLSLLGDSLLVSNCSVGMTDKNLWLYRLQGNKIVAEDAVNLIQDTTRKQVFDFSTQLGSFDGQLYFFASTEEGLVWMGLITNDKLQSVADLKVAPDGGASLALRPGTKSLSAVAYDIDILDVQ